MIKIGFSTTDKVVSRIIRWFTNSQVSHTWVMFDVHGIPMVLEATFEGVRLVPYESFATGHKVVATFDLPYSIEGVRPLLTYLGTSYDFGGLVGSFFVQLGHFLKQKWHNPGNNRKALFCSEMIVDWLQMRGFPGAENLVSAETSPQDLFDLFNRLSLP